MPHTKQQIQGFLEEAGIRPRHRWGQNFLIDLNLMRILAVSAGLQEDEAVLEVGCGTGSLTGLLAERAGAVVAVEIDPYLAGIARRELAEYENVVVVEGDVLERKSRLNPVVLAALAAAWGEAKRDFKLVSNLPYQAASVLQVNLLVGGPRPAGMWVTVQREVAERMIAGPGVKAYGLLSILLQVTGEVKRLRRLGPEVFWPRPKVQSAMIEWRRDEEKIRRAGDVEQVKAVVDMLLGNRRKTIRNCLERAEGAGISVDDLERLGIDPEERGERLGPEAYVQLAKVRAERSWGDG